LCTGRSMALDRCDPLTGVTEQIIGAAIAVHRHLGPGLLESAYQACLEYELSERRLAFARQVTVPIVYRDAYIDSGYRLDLLVDGAIIVEVKSVETLSSIHVAQILTYLKLGNCPVALLLNFNVTSMRQGVRRFTNRSHVRS
jgi:GxxExxY protein